MVTRCILPLRVWPTKCFPFKNHPLHWCVVWPRLSLFVPHITSGKCSQKEAAPRQDQEAIRAFQPGRTRKRNWREEVKRGLFPATNARKVSRRMKYVWKQFFASRRKSPGRKGLRPQKARRSNLVMRLTSVAEKYLPASGHFQSCARSGPWSASEPEEFWYRRCGLANQAD